MVLVMRGRAKSSDFDRSRSDPRAETSGSGQHHRFLQGAATARGKTYQRSRAIPWPASQPGWIAGDPGPSGQIGGPSVMPWMLNTRLVTVRGAGKRVGRVCKREGGASERTGGPEPIGERREDRDNRRKDFPRLQRSLAPKNTTGSMAGAPSERNSRQRERRRGYPGGEGGIDDQKYIFSRLQHPPERRRRRNARRRARINAIKRVDPE